MIFTIEQLQRSSVPTGILLEAFGETTLVNAAIFVAKNA